MRIVCIFFTLILMTLTICNASYTFAETENRDVEIINQSSDTIAQSTYQVRTPEMATGLRSSGMIWIVVGVIVIILFGLILYLRTIDRKISKLEKEIKQ